MCIRDREYLFRSEIASIPLQHVQLVTLSACETGHGRIVRGCLLYTSDAADERSSVDLGGRRIIKKKKNTTRAGTQRREKNCNRSTDTQQGQ